MTGLRSAALRQLALMLIAREAGSDVDAAAIAAAARRAYEALVRVLTPLIGAMGVHALTGRAVRLAAREHSWLGNTHEPEPASEAFDHILVCVERRDPASAADGAAAILAMIGTLLVSLIGEGLTLRLLQEAWPTGFLEPHQEQRRR